MHNKIHEKYMERCLKLASLGKGMVAPNPLVGCVIVYQDKIIGEGYHQIYGKEHAEVNAIQSVKDCSLLKDSTLYVNLEPCAHFGKTPPCSDLIIASQIPKVVVGCTDTYSEVAGKGILKMRKAGIEVIVNVLEKESRKINERFFTSHEKKRPFIILKWAQSSNGMIDINRENETGIYWITDDDTKVLVHQWRSEEAAILVGKNTVINDNPSLTCRLVGGASPIRIIIDPKLGIDFPNYKMGKDGYTTYVLNQEIDNKRNHLTFKKLNDFTIDEILKFLYGENIQSVIVEGGKFTLDRFLESGIWDEARVLKGSKPIENGIPAPIINTKPKESFMFGKDNVKIYLNNSF